MCFYDCNVIKRRNVSQSKFVAHLKGLWDGCWKIPRNRLWKRLEDSCSDFGGPKVRATHFKSVHASGHDARWRAAQSDIQLSAE